MTTVTVEKQAYAQMVFHVPADAVVYLVDQKMSNTGDVRTFNSPILKDGKKFGYPIRVELTRNGKTFKAEGTQLVRAGDKVELKIAFNAELGQLSMVQSEGQASVLELVQVAQQSAIVAQN